MYNEIDWICDECNAYLNNQTGFSTSTGSWICKECGFVNDVSENNVVYNEERYKIQMVNKNTGMVEEDYVDGKIFETEDEAQEYASYMNSCCEQGREIANYRDPFGYEDEDISDSFEYIVVEI